MKTTSCHRILGFFVLIFLLNQHTWAGLMPVDEVCPLVGTAGHGHTYPGATVPFGFVQLSPDTRTPSTPWTVEGWDGCAGYHYTDSSLLGFSHTHLTGTGCGDMGDVLVMPFTGEIEKAGASYVPLEARRFRSRFSHEHEMAHPGYYQVLLDSYNILAELTATIHCGLQRYTFPASDQGHLLIDLVHGIGNKPVGSSLKINGNSITGYRRSTGWAKDRIIYFVIECSRPFNHFGLELDGKPVAEGQTAVTGKNIRCHLDYSTTNAEQIVLRVGLSPTSIEEAGKNLQTEVPGWDFETVKQAAQNQWNENLSRLKIESPDPNVRQTYYTALYHTMTAPTLYNDADGSYPGPDQKNHPGSGFQYYSSMSLWDTFRAENPLLTLIQPERVNDIVQSLLAFYQESPAHLLPMWPLASQETFCMIGYHAVPVIYDAYQKGFRGFDAESAYQAMRDTAMGGQNRQDEYQKLGYIPWVKGQTASVSRTLELAYDDWCVAQMAKALGKAGDATIFAKRACSFTNLWDAQLRFFRAKNPDGTFREPFDPKEVASEKALADEDFTEANAWQYTFAVMQNVPEMVNLYGGKQGFMGKLDQLFNEDSDMPHWRIDVSGIIGQYAHGNEPCHHIAYLYALAGAQYKSAQRVRQIQLTQYDTTPDGICGNDDCGQISAWYVWSAIGLYPVNPASGIYVIGSPLAEKATIQLDPKFFKGGTFTIIAHNATKQNCYIQSAKLNGKLLNRPWVTHAEIANGGTLELEMNILPNKKWGSKMEE